MQTFYIFCSPDQTQTLVDFLSSRPGYGFLGQNPKNQMMVFAIEFEDDIHGVFSLMRPLGATVSRSNPFGEKEKVPA